MFKSVHRFGETSRAVLPAFVVAVLLVGDVRGQAPGKIPADSWVEYLPPDKSFKLLMPGQPDFKTGPAFGRAQALKAYTVDLKFAEFVVTTLQMPHSELDRISLDERFQEGRQKLLALIKESALVSEKKIEIERCPGRELLIRVPDKGHLVARMYVVGTRLYLLTAGGKDYTAEHADVVKFFSSFQLRHAVKAAATSFDGLFGYWSFDDGADKLARDLAGGNHHAAIHGAVPVVGIRGKGLEFDGKSHLSVGPTRRFDFDAGQELSIVAWFKTTENRGTLLRLRNTRGLMHELFIGFENDRPVAKFQTTDDQPGKVRIGMVQGSFKLKTGQWSVKVDDGQWHHVAVSRDKPGILRIYIDGEFIIQSVTGVPGPIRTHERRIGEGFRGSLDEIAVFNRQLSEAEIAALAGKDYGFTDRPRPLVKLDPERDMPDPFEVTIETHGDHPYDLAFEPGGKYLVAAGRFAGRGDRGVLFFDAATGKFSHAYKGGRRVQLARDGKLLLTFDEGIRSYEFDTRERKLVLESGAEEFCLSRDGKYLFATAFMLSRSANSVRKVDLDTGKVLALWLMPKPAPKVLELRCPVYLSAVNGVAVLEGDDLKVLSAEDGKVLWQLTEKCFLHIAASPDGNVLAASVAKGEGQPYLVRLIDAKSGKVIRTLEGTKAGVTLAYTPNGKYLVVAGAHLDFWSVGEGRLVRSVKMPYGTVVANFSPDGRKIAVIMHQSLISVLDVGLSLNLSEKEVKALDVRTNIPPPPRIRKDSGQRVLKRPPFGDAAGQKLDFKDGKIEGFYRFSENEPLHPSEKYPVKIFLLRLAAGQAYHCEVTPNLGEKWTDDQVWLRVEDPAGKLLATNVPPAKLSGTILPLPGRLSFTTPEAGVYRLIVRQSDWIPRSFTLSVTSGKR